MVQEGDTQFDVAYYLANVGPGRECIRLSPNQALFSQGDSADSIFYVQNGWAKMKMVSQTGKDSTITILPPNEFIGEESITSNHGLRLASVIAITAYSALKIDRDEMIRVMRREPRFSYFFLEFLLARSIALQANLVDQLFNSGEQRLARILLRMADFSKSGEVEQVIPRISQETLAEMIGTTRSRVSFFMNRFRNLGHIEYNGCLKVNKSLLTVLRTASNEAKESAD
jgi:CRP/FNR family transcriptional regulator, cyclic AMP receptor protein